VKKFIILCIPLASAGCGGGSDFSSTFTAPNGERIRCDSNYNQDYTKVETECFELPRERPIFHSPSAPTTNAPPVQLEDPTGDDQ
jgi:hypothetical protein